jgi:hypothetical protein
MSRGNVFKLSGNLALGTTPDTYSTSELESIKSSLRLLKARQSQKKSEQNIDINVHIHNMQEQLRHIILVEHRPTLIA